MGLLQDMGKEMRQKRGGGGGGRGVCGAQVEPRDVVIQHPSSGCKICRVLLASCSWCNVALLTAGLWEPGAWWPVRQVPLPTT